MARELGASGYAALLKAPADPAALVNEFIIHLSHDLPLDVALFVAARGAQLGPPLLFMDSAFLERAQLSAVALSMARSLKSLGPTLVEAPPRLSARLQLPAGMWLPASEAGRLMESAVPSFGFSPSTGASTRRSARSGERR